MSPASLSNRLLLSRFMTASGDYAWDFALPLACADAFSDPLRYVAVLILLFRIGLIICLPAIGRWMDGAGWRLTLRAAIGVQIFAVCMASASLACLQSLAMQDTPPDVIVELALFAGILVAYIGSGLGHAAMEITIDNQWIPGLLSAEQFSRINARLRRIVLLTEASVPPVTGLFLTFAGPAGFYGVAAFNMITFILEYWILASVLSRYPQYEERRQGNIPETVRNMTPVENGWRRFRAHPLAPVFLATTCLWFTVLSPHGALFTVFLRTHYGMSEWALSVFRGLSAFVGALATALFPVAERKIGLIRGGGIFIMIQAGCILFAALALFDTERIPLEMALGAIILSRLGLYGYSLSDTQIRQLYIADHERASMVSMARSLNNAGTLLIYALASVFSAPFHFPYLGLATALSIVTGAGLFARWAARWKG